MTITFHNQFRIPWTKGTTISLENVVPILILPAFLYTAAINLFCTIIVFSIMPLLLGYLYFKSSLHQTKFFVVFFIFSIIFIWILFQSTVPMMEILPEENIIFIILLVCSVFFFYKTRSIAEYHNELNKKPETVDKSDSLDEEENNKLLDNIDVEADGGGSPNNGNVCQYCAKQISARTYHCPQCQICVYQRDHHNYWLDCCIGGTNRKFFLLGCISGIFALGFSSNLSLTSVCHPFLIANVFGIHILIPDDCSSVYDQYDVSVCFVSALYSIMVVICISIVLCYQVFFISKGLTGMTEWRANNSNKISQRNVLQNWVNFLCK